jgi:4-hydroxy-tetrahydrodipicolinate reductase
MAEIKVGIMGCGGRMGRMLVAELQGIKDMTLVGGTEVAGSDLVGRDIGELAGIGTLGIAAVEDAAEVVVASSVVIDFSSPEGVALHARLAAQSSTALIIGTTGIDEDQAEAIDATAKVIPIVWAPNMSVAMTLFLGLVTETAKRLGEDYDIEVLEMHHRAKVDAPSGTALAMGQAAAAGRGIDLATHSKRVRDGQTGPRKAGDIGFATLRGGDVVGDHTVIFASDGERLEFTHRATSRRIFAKGALRAARWAVGQKPGLYSMEDVVGL